MSELTEFLHGASDPLPWRSSRDNTSAKVARRALAFLEAHEAAIRAEAERGQFEADCKANCYACERGEQAVQSIGGWWIHQSTGYDRDCTSSRIRSAAYAKAHAAKEKTEAPDGK